MPALVSVLLSRLPQLALALLMVVALVLPALAQDLQPDPGPELLQPPAPAAQRDPAPTSSPLAGLANELLVLLIGALIVALRQWLEARRQRDDLIHTIERADDGRVKAATARLENRGLDKRVAKLYPPAAALLLVGLLALAGCRGLSAEGEAEVREAIAANESIVAAPDAPPGAREVAQDNADVLWQLLYHEGEEDDVPLATRERREARRPQ